MSRSAGLALVAALQLAGAACSGPQPSERTAVHAVSTFNDDVRWQRFVAASRRVIPDLRERWLRAMERAAANLRIVDSRIQTVEVTPDKAIYDVDLSFYRQDAMILETTRRRQTWRQVEGVWLLESERTVERPPEEAEPVELPEF